MPQGHQGRIGGRDQKHVVTVAVRLRAFELSLEDISLTKLSQNSDWIALWYARTRVRETKMTVVSYPWSKKSNQVSTLTSI
eukprot:1379348-Amorphochlora_amoeboformis.AAC.2